jgi:hypothetical protein
MTDASGVVKIYQLIIYGTGEINENTTTASD